MTQHLRNSRAALASDPTAAPGPCALRDATCAGSPTFLFSVDLEDVRDMIPDGQRYAERVPVNTGRLLDFLAAHGARCTFFTVGDVARRYPDLLRRIADAGHEIACHGDVHTPLDRLEPASFRADVECCLASFARAGIRDVTGFRAPMGSLTAETTWAYPVLRELGFAYSSSVHAAPSPLYGWPGFGEDVPKPMDGVWEVPPTLTGLPLLNVPLVGGVFLRTIPFPAILALYRRRLARRGLVVAYLHPYDVDHEQERFMHPEIDDSRLFNWLMFWNRKDVFRRLDRLFGHGARVVPFREYVRDVLSPSSPRPSAPTMDGSPPCR
jgi:polysaccharide deacetylase family protein (PEP-CTERM system associated)